jgi:hypothetical protein
MDPKETLDGETLALYHVLDLLVVVCRSAGAAELRLANGHALDPQPESLALERCWAMRSRRPFSPWLRSSSICQSSMDLCGLPARRLFLLVSQLIIAFHGVIMSMIWGIVLHNRLRIALVCWLRKPTNIQ